MSAPARVRVALEDYGDVVYALPAPGADLGARLGEISRLDGGGPYRWKTTVGDRYQLHTTKAQARRDLRTRAQVAVDAKAEAVPVRPVDVRDCPDMSDAQRIAAETGGRMVYGTGDPTPVDDLEAWHHDAPLTCTFDWLNEPSGGAS